MPKMPQAYIPPTDGIHIYSVRIVETKLDSFKKPQEVVTCAVDPIQGQEENTARLYFGHANRKAIDQGVEAGIIGVDGDNWEVIPGTSCRVLIQNGKMVQVFKL